MILFLGDSFTWGQGLFIHKWIEDGTIFNKEYKTPPEYNHEFISYQDDEYRKQHHFPALVSKHLNKSYGTIWGNGGCNSNIKFILETINNQFYGGKSLIDFFVIQFTCPTRSLGDDVSDEAIENEIREIDEIIRSYNKKWIGLTWRPEHGKILQEKFLDNLIELPYKGISYNNFEDILSDTDNNFTINRFWPGTHDSHFSKPGHEFISNCIINKIKNSDIY